MLAAAVGDVRNYICRILWVLAIFIGVEITMGTGKQILASEMVFGGLITLSGRNTKSDPGVESDQLGLTTTINGNGYIWRPWYATLGLKLDLSQISTEVEHNNGSEKTETEYKLVSGNANLNLFPRSRFPMEALVQVFDSRTESETVGVPLEDIDTIRRERFGVTQRYRPKSGNSSYAIQGNRTRILKNDGFEEVTEDMSAWGSHRFKSQSLHYNANVKDTLRDQESDRFNERQGSFGLNHGYRSDKSFLIDTSIDVTRSEERLESEDNPMDTTSSDQTGSAASFMTWRPIDSKWTFRANVSANKQERSLDDVDSEARAASASSGMTYEFTQSLRLSGNAGVTRARMDDHPEVESEFQDASLTYSPQSIPVGAANYKWTLRSAVSNNTTNQAESTQTGTLEVMHGLERLIHNNKGPTVSLSVNQSATRFGNSEGSDLTTISHTGTSAVKWVGRKTTSRVHLMLEDTRDKGHESDPVQKRNVDRITQRMDWLGGHQWSMTRSSTLEGDANTGATRVIEGSEENYFDHTRLGIGYSIRHAFRVELLRFRSRLEYSIQRSKSNTGISNDDEKRSSWDNRFDYTIGLLSLALRRTWTAINDQGTVTTAFSLSRRF